MLHLILAVVLLAPIHVEAISCPGLVMPIDGEIVRPYAPIGRYAGHWGIDIAAAEGSAVGAADGGTVSFAGEVAGVKSVTVDHGGGLRTSYSYLSEIGVRRGQWVAERATVGYSGLDHELTALHFSVRVGDVYQDPQRWLGCLSVPHPALSLVPVPVP